MIAYAIGQALLERPTERPRQNAGHLMVSWVGASGRGKTRDAKLALGAQNKEMGRLGQAQDNPRFRGAAHPRSPAKVGRGFGVNGNVWRI